VSKTLLKRAPFLGFLFQNRTAPAAWVVFQGLDLIFCFNLFE